MLGSTRRRKRSLWSIAVLLSVSTLAGAFATKSLASTPPTARYLPIGPTPITNVVHYQGARLPAGLLFYRIGSDTVPAYSLHIGTQPSSGTILDGVDPPSSGTTGLAFASELACISEQRHVARPLNRRTAAAIQVAIWHYTDYLPVTARTVPRARLRSLAAHYVLQAEDAVRFNRQGCGLSQRGWQTAPFAPTASVAVAGESVDFQIINVTLSTGSENTYYQKPQILELRVDSIPAFICTAQTSTIVLHDLDVAPIDTPCGQGNPGVGPIAQYTVRRGALHDGKLRGQDDFNLAIVRIPRQDHDQRLTLIWNSESQAGSIFLPRRPSAPMITADTLYDNLTATSVVKPENITDFGSYLQRTLLARILPLGISGVALLAFVLLVFVTARDWFVGLAKLTARILKRVAQRVRGAHRSDGG